MRHLLTAWFYLDAVEFSDGQGAPSRPPPPKKKNNDHKQTNKKASKTTTQICAYSHTRTSNLPFRLSSVSEIVSEIYSLKSVLRSENTS